MLSCLPVGAFCIVEAFLEQDPSGTLQPHLPGSHAAKQRASSFVRGDKVPTCLSLFTKGRDVSRVRMGGWDIAGLGPFVLFPALRPFPRPAVSL